MANADVLLAETRTTATAAAPLERLNAAEISSVVMHGDQSPALAQRFALRLSEGIEGASLHEVANSGHMAPVLDAPAFAQTLESLFLRERD